MLLIQCLCNAGLTTKLYRGFQEILGRDNRRLSSDTKRSAQETTSSKDYSIIIARVYSLPRQLFYRAVSQQHTNTDTQGDFTETLDWTTLFLGDINTGTWPSRLEESQMMRSMVMGPARL
jgi:hypothetical protein